MRDCSGGGAERHLSQKYDSPQESAHIAVDLGASSGRVFLGHVGHELVLEELHRFPNPVEHRDGHLRWNPRLLLREIQTSLGIACESLAGVGHSPHLVTIGVDTWGVDYCLLDASPELIEDPICYRDLRTTDTVAEVLSVINANDLYQRTGNQLLHINTLFQLWSHVRSGHWPSEVAAICLMPDLFHFWLSGTLNIEYTIASTSQLLRAGTKEWDADLLSLIGLPRDCLPTPTGPGRRLGSVRAELLAKLVPGRGPDQGTSPGAGPAPYPITNIEVVTPASHDTASAVVGTPLTKGWAFLSCGTWSLLGLELPEPELGALARRYEFSNEGGPEDTIRFLKNVTGLWILNSCLELWCREGQARNHDELLTQLAEVVPGTSFIVPDDPRFLAPMNMLREISGFLHDTEQAVVQSPVDVARLVLDSLALRFAQIIDQLAKVTGRTIPGIHAVGGGSQNHYLMQATANACQLTVVAGPVEAAALGNVLTQAIGVGSLRDVSSARRWAHAEISLRTFSPRHQAEWSASRAQFAELSEAAG